MRANLRSTYFLSALVLGAAAGSAGVAMLPTVVYKLSYAAESGKAVAAREEINKANDVSLAFKQAAKAVRPSVVTISSVKLRKPVAQRQLRRSGPQVPDEFRRFFGDDQFDRFFNMPHDEGSHEQRGMGSGVIISGDGYILTNNHVVQGADEVTVTLSDNRDYKGEVVGTDKGTDVAVLKIQANNLIPAPLGDSDQMEVGDWVLAIGSPMELKQSVTAGIISAKSRHVGITGGGYEDFLQTDAAINPGNSGGPLVNLRGEVIGINTAIATRTGGYMGIGFAIPSNLASSIMHQIQSSGKVTRGRIGAALQDLTDDLAESYGFKSKDGVLVAEVLPDSPAQRAGLKPEDIVTKYQGKSVKSLHELRSAVAATTPGTDAELQIFRDGKSLTLQVRVDVLDEKDVATIEPTSAEETVGDLGISVQTVTPELAKQLRLRASTQGVIVTDVEPGSVAARAGLETKDVITRIGNAEIASLADYRTAMKDQNWKNGVRMQVVRDGLTRFVFVRGK